MLPQRDVNVKIRLDAKTVGALVLPPGRADEICWDAELEGFGLRLRRRTNGGLLRNWVAQYRAAHHTRRVTIGAADKITPAQARDAARRILARVELGHDPQAEKAAKRQQATHTFRSVVVDYLDAKASELRPGSLRIARSLSDRHLLQDPASNGDLCRYPHRRGGLHPRHHPQP